MCTEKKHNFKNIIGVVLLNLLFLPLIVFFIYGGISSGLTALGWALMLIFAIGPLAAMDIILTYAFLKKKPLPNNKSVSGTVDNHSAQSKSNYDTVNNPYSASETKIRDDTQAVVLAEGLFDRMLALGLEKYLTRTYFPFSSIMPEDFQSDEKMTQKCSAIFGDILNYLDLVPIDLSVTISDENSENKNVGKETAGQYSSSGFLGLQKQIKITVKKSYSSDNIIAILCHESTHFFMDAHGLKSQIEEINEIRTDVLAIILGFGEILKKGYAKKEEYTYAGNTTTIHTNKLGYITDYDCLCVLKIVEKRKNKLQHDMEEEKKKKQKLIEEMMKLAKLVETAKAFDSTFHELLNNISMDKINDVQMIIYEYENLNFKNRYVQWTTALGPNSDLLKSEQAISSCNEYCEKMLSWIQVLQS